MSNKLTGINGGAWDSSTHKKIYPKSFNYGLANFIINQIKPKEALEFGSGLGYIAKYINDNSSLENYYCIEPNKIDGEYDQIKGPKLLPLDIFTETHPHIINHKFDLVLSIEVAEHIEFEKHDDLFDFLVAHSKNWIVFSGARIGQGGIGHIAERDEDDWRSEFIRRGMIFEKNLTEKIRQACDEKNINHKKNVMVFRRPSYLAALDEIESKAKPYLNDILAIVQSKAKYLDGNLFYVYLQDAINGMPHDSLKVKRDNFVNLVKNKTKILEIGFNAGHSILLALLVNDKVKVTVIDTCQHPYTIPCFNYLDKLFPNRIKLIKGDSVGVLAEIKNEKFDLIHYDGGKEKTIKKDLELTRSLVTPNHILIIDDTQNEKLNEVVLEYEKKQILELKEYAALTGRLNNYKWKHTIASFIDEKALSITESILTDLQNIFDNSVFPSIYTNNVNVRSITGYQRANSLIHLIIDINDKGLPGYFVECGVAAGHSSVVAALTLKYINNKKMKLYLYDTYNGFSFELPDELDLKNKSIKDYDLNRYQSVHTSEESVFKKMIQTGIQIARVNLIKGLVEDTIPEYVPEKISILRLDVDLYKPTLHCLKYLYPRLQVGGYLIIDDYGHWDGCKKAVNEFFEENNMELQELITIDYTCRVYLKQTS